MSKLLYKNEIEINGHIDSDNGKLLVIKLATGGTMTLSKEHVKLVPDKPKKKADKAKEVK